MALGEIRERPSTAHNPPHILLVEDNAVALHFIETILRQAGLIFSSAMDGERALILAKTKHFDLIITDIGLPGICGYAFATALRQWEKDTQREQTPIIGLTARSLKEETLDAFKAGINRMLSKPISLKLIHELIEQFVPHHPFQTPA